MIRCPKCKALADVIDLNFVKLKREGEPADKSDLLDKEGQCPVCSEHWFLDGKANELYDEYKKLKNEVDQMVVVYDPRVGPPYDPKPMKFDVLKRMKELAKILASEHKHNLDVDAGEWFEIDKEASY